MMRALALIALLLVACSKDGTTVEVQLSASPPLAGITRLHLGVSNGSRQREYDVTPPASTLPPAINIAVRVPPDVSGSLHIVVEAFADLTKLGEVEGDAPLTPGQLTILPLSFGTSQPDLRGGDLPRGDQSGVDGAAVDLSGNVSVDDLPMPDDLLAEDLSPPPDLVPPLLPLAIFPASWPYGSHNEGATSTKTFTIQNQTASPTTSLAVTSTDAAFEIVDVDCVGRVLASGGGDCTVDVVFHAVGAGTRSAQLIVTSTTHQGSADLSGVAVGIAGRGCSDPAHCQSNNCVDGFCCDMPQAACNGCKACNVATKEGTCSPVLVGTDPHGACTGICEDQCNGSGACRPATAGKVCQTETCANQSASFFQWLSTTSGVHKCDGVLTTCPATSAPCAGKLVCDTSAGVCDGSCTTDAECVDGNFCNGATCEAVRNTGAACTRGVQCYSKKCNGSTCESTCVNNQGCYPGGPICHNPGGGKQCFYCTTPGGPTLSCVGSGWGNTCVTDTSSNGFCTCANDTECNDQAPLCATASIWLSSPNKFCHCNTASATNNCLAWQVCTNPGASGQCKNRAGWPCVLSSQCASNSCSNGLCL